MLRERHKQRTCEADSIEALPRGGQARSSDEAVVMAAEAKQLFFCNLTESDLRSDSPVV